MYGEIHWCVKSLPKERFIWLPIPRSVVNRVIASQSWRRPPRLDSNTKQVVKFANNDVGFSSELSHLSRSASLSAAVLRGILRDHR